jgi:hypothetical protein
MHHHLESDPAKAPTKQPLRPCHVQKRNATALSEGRIMYYDGALSLRKSNGIIIPDDTFLAGSVLMTLFPDCAPKHQCELSKKACLTQY